MAVSRTVQNFIAKGDLDSLEDDWLRHMSDDSADLDYFVGVARALVGNDEEERARFLLEMLDDELTGKKLWSVRLKLLQRAGSLLMAPEEIHPAILDSLRRLHADCPNLQTFIDATGLERAVHDLPKTWEKVGRLEGLAVFDVGSVVWMENRGVGKVVEVNRELQSFKVDFEGYSGLAVGFRAAPKLLKPLPPGHILRRTVEEPEAVRELAVADPSELLHQVLISYDQPLKAAEIRQAVAAVVSEKEWTSWWGAARKHPQVVASGAGARQTYGWAESSADALSAVWETFHKADPIRQMELLRRDGGRDPKLQRRMAQELAGVAEKAADSDPGLAFEIWFVLERACGAPEDVPWSPETLLQGPSPTQLFSGIRERLLRERAYTMYRERREDWPSVYLEALGREDDPRVLDLLADGLANGEPKSVDRFLDGLLAQPQRSPAAFVWLAERAAVDEAFLTRNPTRLLQHILQAPGRDEFKGYRTRLLAQVESGGTVPRLLSHLTEDQARQAEDLLHRAAFLETYQRAQLEAALHLRFPELDKKRETPLYALPASIEAKRAEFKNLIARELPANRKAIEEARALGDLRENFEYKSARQRHEYLSALAEKLEGDLRRVQPISAGADAEEVRIGTRVRLRGEDGGEKLLTILGPWESNPEADVISYESELGQTLLGKKLGDPISVTGAPFRVEHIEAWDG